LGESTLEVNPQKDGTAPLLLATWNIATASGAARGLLCLIKFPVTGRPAKYEII